MHPLSKSISCANGACLYLPNILLTLYISTWHMVTDFLVLSPAFIYHKWSHVHHLLHYLWHHVLTDVLAVLIMTSADLVDFHSQHIPPGCSFFNFCLCILFWHFSVQCLLLTDICGCGWNLMKQQTHATLFQMYRDNNDGVPSSRTFFLALHHSWLFIQFGWLCQVSSVWITLSSDHSRIPLRSNEGSLAPITNKGCSFSHRVLEQ